MKQLVSTVVCTRDRGASVTNTVRSILGNSFSPFEVLVIDQSASDDTAETMTALLSDSRVRYVRTTTRGVCVARNIALDLAVGELVLFTDDDCEVPADWISRMVAAFELHSSAAVVFCNVDAAPHDARAGFIPSYHRRGDRLVRTLLDKCTARGIGAGFGVRRRPVLAMGGFDELLGPGARFPACEDGDLAVRALLMGHHVYETASVAVVHHGFRRFDQGRNLSRRDWTGIGAAYAKPLKAGHLSFAVVPLFELARYAIWPLFADALAFRRPRGLTRIGGFARGFAGALRMGVDKRTLLFEALPRSGDSAVPRG